MCIQLTSANAAPSEVFEPSSSAKLRKKSAADRSGAELNTWRAIVACSPEAEFPINKKNGLQTNLKQFSNARTGHLYIADDNWEFADFVQTVAAVEGWSVSLCSNGADLIGALERSREPAVVYLDLLMPEMDGIETIEKLAELGRALRVRFVTGGPAHNAEAAELIGGARGLSLGPTIYKPVTLNSLKLELLRDLPYTLTLGNSSSQGL